MLDFLRFHKGCSRCLTSWLSRCLTTWNLCQGAETVFGREGIPGRNFPLFFAVAILQWYVVVRKCVISVQFAHALPLFQYRHLLFQSSAILTSFAFGSFAAIFTPRLTRNIRKRFQSLGSLIFLPSNSNQTIVDRPLLSIQGVMQRFRPYSNVWRCVLHQCVVGKTKKRDCLSW